MNLCQSCPRKCNADRFVSAGVCGVGNEIKIAHAGLHFGEEPCISGTNGSGIIFFSGCTLKCVMCQNHQISHEGFGRYISEKKFINIIKDLEQKGAHNINLVTPSHYFSQISDALKMYRPSIPIVYNSSGYDLSENIEQNVFDIYLFDLKYYSSEKAQRYSKCSDYFEVASKAIKTAVNIVGKPIFDDNGIMRRGVVVRHLILPQSTNDSINIIDWLNLNTKDIVFSLMSQYVPMYRANEYPEINRRITVREYNKVLDKCFDCNFAETYIQDLSSASKEFIPCFDLTGVD